MHHLIREKIVDKSIKLEYCPTDLMKADILTKALKEKSLKNRNGIILKKSLGGL